MWTQSVHQRFRSEFSRDFDGWSNMMTPSVISSTSTHLQTQRMTSMRMRGFVCLGLLLIEPLAPDGPHVNCACVCLRSQENFRSAVAEHLRFTSLIDDKLKNQMYTHSTHLNERRVLIASSRRHGNGATEAEIGYLDVAGFGIDQNVVGLEIAVNYKTLMQIAYSFKYLFGNKEDVRALDFKMNFEW